MTWQKLNEAWSPPKFEFSMDALLEASLDAWTEAIKDLSNQAPCKLRLDGVILIVNWLVWRENMFPGLISPPFGNFM